MFFFQTLGLRSQMVVLFLALHSALSSSSTISRSLCSICQTSASRVCTLDLIVSISLIVASIPKIHSCSALATPSFARLAARSLASCSFFAFSAFRSLAPCSFHAFSAALSLASCSFLAFSVALSRFLRCPHSCLPLSLQFLRSMHHVCPDTGCYARLSTL